MEFASFCSCLISNIFRNLYENIKLKNIKNKILKTNLLFVKYRNLKKYTA